METAILTSSPRSAHDLLSLSHRCIGRRRKSALIHLRHADKRNVPASGYFIEAGFSQVQLHWPIGVGSLCIQSRGRGSRVLMQSQIASLLPLGFAGNTNSKKPHSFLAGTGNNCGVKVNPIMLLERRASGSAMSPASVALTSALFPAEGGDNFTSSKIVFCTRISPRSSKWDKWLQLPPRFMSAACRGHNGDHISDEFGPYPWDPSWNASDNEAIEWIQEDIITLFTTDGLIQIGGSLVPHQLSATERRQLRGKAPIRYRRFREEDYMDPKQGLCLGAIFDIVATNGLDMGRRLCVFGFCRSIEMLSDVVEDTVLEQGGEVVVAAKGNRGGLNEKLSMTVAVPLLWGVPPAVDTLNYAIRCGGGIVEKVSCQWEFL